LNWISMGIGIGAVIVAMLVFLEVKRWANQKASQNKVLLAILPPTGIKYYALATKDEKMLKIKSPTQRDKSHVYIVDKEAAWDAWWPFSDFRLTQVLIKEITYYEGQKEPALKRGIDEIANARTVAIIQDSNDLAALAREVRGDNDTLFGAKTGVITVIVCAIILIVAGVGTYYTYKGYDYVIRTSQIAQLLAEKLGIIVPVVK
jgi:hypothetical protein